MTIHTNSQIKTSVHIYWRTRPQLQIVWLNILDCSSAPHHSSCPWCVSPEAFVSSLVIPWPLVSSLLFGPWPTRVILARRPFTTRLVLARRLFTARLVLTCRPCLQLVSDHNYHQVQLLDALLERPSVQLLTWKCWYIQPIAAFEVSYLHSQISNQWSSFLGLCCHVLLKKNSKMEIGDGIDW